MSERDASRYKQTLRRAVAQRDEAQRAYERAQRTIYETLPKAKAAGLSGVELGAILGVSRQRIHAMLAASRDPAGKSRNV